MKAFDLITERLFEGNDLYGYIPKRLGSKVCYINYKTVGVIIGHAFMTCGEIFGRCQEWVLRAICDPLDVDLIKCIINSEMIPKNSGTVTTDELIRALEGATAEEDLDIILNKRENMEKINNTQWDIAEAISIKSKDKLVQEVIYDELVLKRTEQLNTIRDGLAYIGLLPWLQKATTIAGIIIQIHQRDSPKKFLEKCLTKILAESEMNDV